MPGGINGPAVLNGPAYVYPSKTLAQLRAEVLVRMGFITPMLNPPTRTLAALRQNVYDACGFADPHLESTRALSALRDDLRDLLGLADPFTAGVTRTLGELRTDVAQALGFGNTPYNATLTAFLDLHINEAYQRVYRRLEMDTGAFGAPPPRFASDLVATQIDYVPVQILAIALAKSHYGAPDAKVYFDQLEQYFRDLSMRAPPNFDGMADTALNEAQQTIFRRLELDKGSDALPTRMVADADQTTIDYVPVLKLAAAHLKAKLGQPDAKLMLDETERYLADYAARRPPHIEERVNHALIEAQQTIYRRYEFGITNYALGAFAADGDSTTVDYRPVLALAIADLKGHLKQPDARRYFDEVEKYFADIYRRKPPDADAVVTGALRDANEQLFIRYPASRLERWWTWTLVAGERFYDVPKEGATALDLRKVQSVWISDGGTWSQLSRGIHPLEFSVDQPGLPAYYELGEYIELWPAPSGEMELYLRGDIALRPFEADADVPSVDYHAVFLKALAITKAHYQQRDAMIVDRDLVHHVADLIALTHKGRRYIPGDNRAGLYIAGASIIDYGMNVRRVEDGGVRRMEDA